MSNGRAERGAACQRVTIPCWQASKQIEPMVLAARKRKRTMGEEREALGLAVPGARAARGGNVKLSGAPRNLPDRPPKFSASTQAFGWPFYLFSGISNSCVVMVISFPGSSVLIKIY